MKADARINEAIDKLFAKIQLLNFRNLNISEYNRNYLIKYIDNYSYFMSFYAQLLQKALKKLNKPVSESTFIDYGGGCGMLSYLAKEIGFKTVVYTDIYEVSANDAQTISKSLDIAIDYFMCGDVEAFCKEINRFNLKPDLICSFDVLEHIYDLEAWIKTINQLKSEFSLLFMTSANSNNPFVSNRLKKLHLKSELKGSEKTTGWKGIDLNTSYLEERKNIIRRKFPELNDSDLNLLSIKSRGLRKDDIEKVVYEYIKTGKISYEIKHSTNTCDPYTGNWTENLIDLKELKIFIRRNNLHVVLSNSFHVYSKNKLLNAPKYLLNQLIRVLGPQNLFFSPTYTLEIQKSQTQIGLD
ncbi:MAG: methyltransferase domain-containing protein [Bacteroidota bacterium]|nr:methyltransferase domain-containing protein [Bacteroidota bacterium]